MPGHAPFEDGLTCGADGNMEERPEDEPVRLTSVQPRLDNAREPDDGEVDEDFPVAPREGHRTWHERSVSTWARRTPSSPSSRAASPASWRTPRAVGPPRLSSRSPRAASRWSA